MEKPLDSTMSMTAMSIIKMGSVCLELGFPYFVCNHSIIYFEKHIQVDDKSSSLDLVEESGQVSQDLL